MCIHEYQLRSFNIKDIFSLLFKGPILYSLSYHYFSPQTTVDQPGTITKNKKHTIELRKQHIPLSVNNDWLISHLPVLLFSPCLAIMDGLHISYMSLNHKCTQSRVLLQAQDIRQAVFYICAPKYFHQDFIN